MLFPALGPIKPVRSEEFSPLFSACRCSHSTTVERPPDYSHYWQTRCYGYLFVTLFNKHDGHSSNTALGDAAPRSLCTHCVARCRRSCREQKNSRHCRHISMAAVKFHPQQTQHVLCCRSSEHPGLLTFRY